MGTKIILITGTGTDVGKTVAAGILVAGLNADYWKPLQTGIESGKDSDWIAQYALQPSARIHPEVHNLVPPEAPLIAANRSGLTLSLADLHLPKTTNSHLIIEGAGGLMVPITEQDTYLDWFCELKQPIILVVGLYLGGINHCLLSVAALQACNANLMGILFVARKEYDGTEARAFIRHYTQVPDLGCIPYLPTMNREILVQVFRNETVLTTV